MKKKELEKIIERDAPGYTLAGGSEGQDERAANAEPEETSPDIDELRQAYLGEPEVEASSDAPEATDAGDDEPEDQIVAIRPTAEATDPFDATARPKTVVVSGKEKRIVGRQG